MCQCRLRPVPPLGARVRQRARRRLGSCSHRGAAQGLIQRSGGWGGALGGKSGTLRHRDLQKGPGDFWGWIFQGSPQHLSHAGGPLAAPHARGRCGRQQGAGVAQHGTLLSTAGCSNGGTCPGRAWGCDARSAGTWQAWEVCRKIARELSHGHKERRKPALRAGSRPPTQVGQHGPCTCPLPGTRPPHCPARHLLQLAVLRHSALSDKRTSSSCL